MENEEELQIAELKREIDTIKIRLDIGDKALEGRVQQLEWMTKQNNKTINKYTLEREDVNECVENWMNFKLRKQKMINAILCIIAGVILINLFVTYKLYRAVDDDIYDLSHKLGSLNNNQLAMERETNRLHKVVLSIEEKKIDFMQKEIESIYKELDKRVAKLERVKRSNGSNNARSACAPKQVQAKGIPKKPI